MKPAFAFAVVAVLVLLATTEAVRVSLKRHELEHHEHQAFLDRGHLEHRRILSRGDAVENSEDSASSPEEDLDESAQDSEDDDDARAIKSSGGTEIHRIPIKDFLNVIISHPQLHPRTFGSFSFPLSD